MKRFETEWSQYQAQVISPNAGEVQLRETKKAFYAGASSVIAILGSLFDPKAGVEPTEEDCRVLEDVWKELDDFFKGEMKQENQGKKVIQ